LRQSHLLVVLSLSNMQANQPPFAYLGQQIKFELKKPDLPHMLYYSQAGLEAFRIPSSYEVPGTRLVARDTSSSRASSPFVSQNKEAQHFLLSDRLAAGQCDEFAQTKNDPPMSTRRDKEIYRSSTKNRPTKPQRMLCKSLARMVFLFHQANSLKDMAEAENMLARSLHGAQADPRCFKYAVYVLHGMFAGKDEVTLQHCTL